MPSFSPISLSVSEAAKFFGVSTRTIRRAIAAESITYTVVKDRYKITLPSLLAWAKTSQTIEKKLNTLGFGAYVETWKTPKTKGTV